MDRSEPMTPDQWREQWIESYLWGLRFWDRDKIALRPLGTNRDPWAFPHRIHIRVDDVTAYDWDETALIFPETRAAVAKVLRELADEIEAAPAEPQPPRCPPHDYSIQIRQWPEEKGGER